MALNLYRRHGEHCSGMHSPDQRTYEAEELRKGHKKCSCPIYISGTLARRFKRLNTEHTTWPEAKTVAAVREAIGAWYGAATVLPVAAPAPTAERMTIVKARDLFLADHKAHSAPATEKKYREMMRRVVAYRPDYAFVDQWTRQDVRSFIPALEVGQATRLKYLGNLKAFFEFCVENEWIEKNPARIRQRRSRKNRVAQAARQKSPFTDAEIERMHEACDRYDYSTRTLKWSRVGHYRGPEPGEELQLRKGLIWKGEDLRDFIDLAVHTGLRISDLAMFHISRLRNSGECFVRTTKTGQEVFMWLPPWLVARLNARADKHGPYIFGQHQTQVLDVITDTWRRKLKRLWAMCGKWDEPPTPHRFRHTFVRVLLQSRVDLATIADLTGDTVGMIRRHYSKWVPERQEVLTRTLKQAFGYAAEKSASKVVRLTKRA